MSDASKDIELMVFYKREDIALVELVDCNAHTTTRLYHSKGRWSPE